MSDLVKDTLHYNVEKLDRKVEEKILRDSISGLPDW